MIPGCRLIRFAVLVSSLTLLTCYVVYSHQSAQIPATQAGKGSAFQHVITQSLPVDPIAALCTSDSQAHQMQPALTEKPLEANQQPGSAESIWQSPLSPRILSDRGNGSGNSVKMIPPEKLTPKSFQASAIVRRTIMPGSKSGQMFTSSPSTSWDGLFHDFDLFRSELVIQTKEPVLPALAGTITVQSGPVPAPPPDLLNQPQNIQRILADDGHSADESRKAIAPAKIAEFRLYEQTPVMIFYPGMEIDQTKVPASPFYRPLFKLLTPLTINEPPPRSLFEKQP